MSLRVVYEHGPPDEYQVNTRIRAGSESQPLGLRGEPLDQTGRSRVLVDAEP
jgi:hypothetical protein